MCGIAGALGALREGEAERMLDRLAHRGPDDRGQHHFDGGWLGHTRLAIVDVDGGHQPLRTPGGDRWMVGNGEIYNHAEVRARMADEDGVRYLTRSDNEVAMHLLDTRGPDALGELEGMFALLCTAADGSFVAARDPVGIKPLYWTPPDGTDDTVRFASEIVAFDEDVRDRVAAFPPGHAWTPDGGLRAFADAVPERVPGDRHAAAPAPDDLRRTRDALVGAVERQMMGDVPVGVFLSGGLDSTLVAAIAARHEERHGRRLMTFAVGTEGSPDLAAARQAAEYLGTDHHEAVYTAQDAVGAVDDVVRAIEHFDVSLVRSAVPNLLLARMAVQHVKVVLTGEGADELFAGYGYHRGFTDPEELHDELERGIRGLHDLNLQRADRVTMSVGLEARVPFLDRSVIRLALAMPAAWKVADAPGREKRLLREAFEGWLPHELLWREKAQFGDGSGAADVLTRTIEARVSEEELEDEAGAVDPPIRTREELYYHRVLMQHLPGLRVDRTLGRFATA